MNSQQNETLTRTGPGTEMGDLFRRYWIPALLATELPEPDCPPVRVGLLSEKLLAFRDTDGKIGLIGEFCAHRGVSLWFGRNEEHGIRCPYHGWKYDVNGQCVEVPSEANTGYCDKIKLTSYPCVEMGGIIWTYMGPPDKQPPLPAFEWVELPDSHRYLSKRFQECNYLQAMEGGIDSSHVSFLHRGELDTDPLHRNTQGAKYARSTNTVFDILESPGGLVIGARRDAEPGVNYWRLTQWIMPWYTLIPPYGGGHALNGHAWVPIDDNNCIAWTMTFHPQRPLSADELSAMESGRGVHCELIPGTFRPVANRDNDYLMDRAGQKSGRYYSGIKGLAIQDASLQESMGPIADRTRENLVSTDNAILMARQRLLKAARGLTGDKPLPGIDRAHQQQRSASFLLEVNGNFREKAADATLVRPGEAHVAV
ncbi:Ring-hydroxylating dioxygenase, large terminal subunit [Paraburkholderia piptadeniae]|uniref:Ring-hydroxylating dioxygenase, large terminal subunit n=1 Tax=Paraburkholderia piptadeniae TaxID=1701573 RepID=A0A1N7SPF1_9BURK|nr:Rieske 2Fe-2S domain-containing protein [Paraburkholderia piptadeniae]SIT49304.1 Ring-hydroxylating dioxygenase, large terminal subunit [Paraburkholderia piptadeniae]